ncbi:MAG TPA: MBL fold metallo-hydrolase [Mycobacteriales bacterium]|nr:MBL fold metallo-hydrolase [Mycobacteriales bacterium]
MRLTKYTHACVRLENGGAVLVIDPGIWAEGEALHGAGAVLVTHEHADHVDRDALRAALDRDPDLGVWTHADLAAKLAADLDMGDRVHPVAPGDRIGVVGFDVRVFGGQHALVHPDVPVVPNVGFLVDGAVFHPGDSFTLPTVDVDTLLVPAHAPWQKLAEAVDYTRAVRPRLAFGIHDALLNDRGLATTGAHLRGRTEAYGVDYRPLAPGESTDL